MTSQDSTRGILTLFIKMNSHREVGKTDGQIGTGNTIICAVEF